MQNLNIIKIIIKFLFDTKAMKLVTVYIFVMYVTHFKNVIHAQSYYYYFDQKIGIEKDCSKIYIKFKSGTSVFEKKQIITNSGLIKNSERLNHEDTSVYNAIYYLVDEVNHDILNNLINRLRDNEFVEKVQAFYQLKDKNYGTSFTPSNNIYVKLKNESYITELHKLAEQKKLKISSTTFRTPNIYMLSIQDALANTLELANLLYETNYFEFVSYNNLYISKNLLSCNTTDNLFGQQWSLNNSGQSGGSAGADIKVCNAWEVTKGNENIVVAVIDIGVDKNHADLIGNMVQGKDFIGIASDGTPNLFDYHGTYCAGIIAASENNIGMVGIAPYCKIMPIRFSKNSGTQDVNIADKPSNGDYLDVADGYDPPFVYTSDGLKDAIEWAWQNGADILNMSFQVYSDPIITNAISDATIYGRGGLGSIVLVSAGNNGSNTLNYPAVLTNVIAVGASDKCDKRASINNNQNSCGNNLNSNYGEGLSVVAPGVDILATDISGEYGSNTQLGSSGDYNFMTGTSAAAPVASGVMALILSVNPCLTYLQARDILETTCDQVGGYTYDNDPNYPNGKWYKEMGYGRVNAERAVLKAQNLYLQNISYSNNISKSYLHPRIYTGYAVTNSEPNGNFIVENNARVILDGTDLIEMNDGTSIIPAASGNGFFSAQILKECPVSGEVIPKKALVEYDYSNHTNESLNLNKERNVRSSYCKLYPNPTTGIVNIEYSTAVSNSVVNITVYDITGRVMHQKSVDIENEGIHTEILNLSNFSKGAYYIEVRNNNGVRYNNKITLY
jgi:subtilisin family serine protease